mmetsp:Transcript_1280/g.2609  ORF Transcript_1280/g.2609 Transcript_1280/m.2609 type:complete len:448 (+) Transcript_1280:594-1937(+)
MIRYDRVIGAGFQTSLADDFHFGFGVVFELVDGHHGVNSEFFGVFDVFDEICDSFLNKFDVFVGVFCCEWLSRLYRRTAAMHLECTDCSDDDCALWFETRLAAFDVEKLLHANIGTKPSLGNHISFFPYQLQRQSIGNDTRISYGNIRKRPGVNQYRGPFHGLHQGGQQGIFHQHRQGTATSQIIGSDGLFGLGVAYHHISQLLAQIRQVFRQSQHRHDFRRDRDIKSGVSAMLFSRSLSFDRLSRLNRLIRSHTNGHIPQMPITRIQHPLPSDRRLVEIQPGKLGPLLLRQILWQLTRINPQFLQPLLHNPIKRLVLPSTRQTQPLVQRLIRLTVLVKHPRIDRRRQKIIRRRNRVDIPRQMQVELLHGHHLRVPSPGGPSLDAEGGALRRLADAGEALRLEYGAQGLGHADGGGGFAFAEGGGVDARADDVVAVGGGGEAREGGG